MGLGKARSVVPSSDTTTTTTTSPEHPNGSKESTESVRPQDNEKQSSGKFTFRSFEGETASATGNRMDSKEASGRSSKALFSRLLSAATSSASAHGTNGANYSNAAAAAGVTASGQGQGQGDNDKSATATSSSNRLHMFSSKTESGHGKRAAQTSPADLHLHYYAKTGQLDGFTRRLVEHKGDLNAVYEYGDTLLILASRKGFVSIVKEILNYSLRKVEEEGKAAVNLEMKNSYGCTALMEAARFNRVEICSLLIDHGADLESKNFLGETALIRAACYNQDGVVNLLLAHGAQTYGLKIAPRIAALE